MVRLPKLGKKNITYRKFLFSFACKCLRWGDVLSFLWLVQKLDKLHCASTWTICSKAPVEARILKSPCNKKIPFVFLQILKVRCLTRDRNILSFDFHPRAVYFECKFWISGSAITQVQY